MKVRELIAALQVYDPNLPVRANIGANNLSVQGVVLGVEPISTADPNNSGNATVVGVMITGEAGAGLKPAVRRPLSSRSNDR
jgi:hypothetical protein